MDARRPRLSEPGAFYLRPAESRSWPPPLSDADLPVKLMALWPRRRHDACFLLPCDLVWQSDSDVSGHGSGQLAEALVPWAELAELVVGRGLASPFGPDPGLVAPPPSPDEGPRSPQEAAALVEIAAIARARLEQARIDRVLDADSAPTPSAQPARPRL